MASPQHGIFALGTRSHLHLQLDVGSTTAPSDLLAALREMRDLAATVAGVNVVVGLGAELCRRILPTALPADLSPFAPIRGVGADPVTMPADQHDLWIWLHSTGPDTVFDLARAATRRLHGLAVVVTEQASFTYQASRDMTGFEDGTENPPLDVATFVATIPAGQPGEGGSVVLLQRWEHDLDGFELLDRDEQCQVFGRDRDTNAELPDDVRSPRAHISRVVIEDDDGEELEVFRRSTAFGGVLEHGLMFVAFSADQGRLQRMLGRMVGEGDGLTDRLTDFSRSTGGAYYVTPPIEAFAGSDAP